MPWLGAPHGLSMSHDHVALGERDAWYMVYFPAIVNASIWLFEKWGYYAPRWPVLPPEDFWHMRHNYRNETNRLVWILGNLSPCFLFYSMAMCCISTDSIFELCCLLWDHQPVDLWFFIIFFFLLGHQEKNVLTVSFKGSSTGNLCHRSRAWHWHTLKYDVSYRYCLSG